MKYLKESVYKLVDNNNKEQLLTQKIGEEISVIIGDGGQENVRTKGKVNVVSDKWIFDILNQDEKVIKKFKDKYLIFRAEQFGTLVSLREKYQDMFEIIKIRLLYNEHKYKLVKQVLESHNKLGDRKYLGVMLGENFARGTMSKITFFVRNGISFFELDNKASHILLDYSGLTKFELLLSFLNKYGKQDNTVLIISYHSNPSKLQYIKRLADKYKIRLLVKR